MGYYDSVVKAEKLDDFLNDDVYAELSDVPKFFREIAERLTALEAKGRK